MEREKARRNPLPNLLEEIILDILLRLPVKSLVRFSCVCKSWLALFASPDFTRIRNQRRLILTCFEEPSFSIKSMDFEALLNDNNVVNLDLALKTIPRKYNTVQVLGSCNGLLLCRLNFSANDGLFLWNPSTRQCKELPQSGNSCETSSTNLELFYGFGYDSSINDYKVVRGVCSFVNYLERRTKSKVEVYSRKTNSWKRIRELPYPIIFQEKGAFFDKFLHWSGYLELGQRSLSMVVFDLEKEKFGEVLKPDYGDGNCFIDRVGVLEGSLCVVCDHCESYDQHLTLSIWVMKEYGVSESWTKLISIPSILAPSVEIVPLCITKGGELVMQWTWERIVKCNLKEMTFIDLLGTNNIETEAAMYVESCVPV